MGRSRLSSSVILGALTPIVTAAAVFGAPAERRVRADDLAALQAASAGDSIHVEGVLNRTGSRQETLRLERFDVFAPGADIVIHTATGVARQLPPHRAYYKGSIEGVPGSRVLLSVGERGERRGLAFDSAGIWMLGPHDRASKGALEMRRIDLRAVKRDRQFRCDEELLPYEASAPIPAEAVRQAALELAAPEGTLPARTARLAIETDFEFYNLFGNTAEAIEYVADVVASMSILYEAEISTSLTLVHVSLWTTATDPWDQSSLTCQLFQFSRYWNVNNGAVTRSLAHMLSGVTPGGGVAWRDKVCVAGSSQSHNGACPALTPQTDAYVGAYGLLRDVDGEFNYDDPGVVWDIVSSAHEIGHIFSSPHTHCYAGNAGNPEQIDRCDDDQSLNLPGDDDTCNGTTHNWDNSGCSCSAETLPGAGSVSGGTPGAGNGTVMSYCHTLAPGMDNVTYTLGAGHGFGVAPERVPNKMAAFAAAANGACIGYLPGTSVIFRSGFENEFAFWTVP